MHLNFFLSKTKTDRSIDATVVKGVMPYMVQSLMKSEQVLPTRLEKAKHVLQQDDSMIILPADKGGKTVVMDRYVYKLTMLRMLSHQEVYKKYNRNPMERIPTEIRTEVKRIADSLPNEFAVFKKENKDSLVKFPQPAKFYGLPKIHKEDPITHILHLRPIVLVRHLAEVWLCGRGQNVWW